MAFSSTNSPQLMLDGLGTFPSTQGSSVLPRVWLYGSTHLVADITAIGFFAGCAYVPVRKSACGLATCGSIARTPMHQPRDARPCTR